MAIKADHLLIALSGLVIGLLVAPISWVKPDLAAVLNRDCALFYGDLGSAAELQCRTEMLDGHGLEAKTGIEAKSAAAPPEPAH